MWLEEKGGLKARISTKNIFVSRLNRSNLSIDVLDSAEAFDPPESLNTI
jgi:hypothetical protein